MRSNFLSGFAAAAFCSVSLMAHGAGEGAAGDGPVKGGFIIGIRGGVGSSGWYFNISASVGFQAGTRDFNLNGFVSGSFHTGSQLGTSSARPFSYDVAGGAYLMAGKGEARPRHFYLLNYNMPSPFPNTKDFSVSWGQMVTYNYAINAVPGADAGPGFQTQGMAGLRLGKNLALSYHNDSRYFPTFAAILRKPLNIKHTDAGWTGGLIMDIYNVEIVYENFSGYRGKLDPVRPIYYPQTAYHQSLNKAATFVQYDGFRIGTAVRNSGLRLDYFTEAWLQNFIHNCLSREPRYRYTYLNKFNFGIGANKYVE